MSRAFWFWFLRPVAELAGVVFIVAALIAGAVLFEVLSNLRRRLRRPKGGDGCN